jgi:hypothetical protein
MAKNLCLIQITESRISGTGTESLFLTNHNFQNFWNVLRTSVCSKKRFQNFWDDRKIYVSPNTTIPKFLERAKKLCLIQITESRISGTTTELLFDLKLRFQNFWNDHRISVSPNTTTPEFLEMAKNLFVQKKIDSRISGTTTKSLFAPKYRFQDF